MAVVSSANTGPFFPNYGAGGCSGDVVMSESAQLDFSSLFLLATTAMKEASLMADDVISEQQHQRDGDTENWKSQSNGDRMSALRVRRTKKVSISGKSWNSIARGSPTKRSFGKQPSGPGNGVSMAAISKKLSADLKEVAALDVQIAASPIVGLHATKGVMNVPKTTPKLGAASSRRTTRFKRAPGPEEEFKSTMIGVNFYKRIGKWTAHIWASNSKKQAYLGSYFTMTEAARAYDKAWLKIRAKNGRLNFPHEDHRKDLKEMGKYTVHEYVKFLQKSAKLSKLAKVTESEGVHICPLGLYEVRLRNVATPKKLWSFLGHFRSLQAANRCFRQALERMQ